MLTKPVTLTPDASGQFPANTLLKDDGGQNYLLSVQLTTVNLNDTSQFDNAIAADKQQIDALQATIDSEENQVLQVQSSAQATKDKLQPQIDNLNADIADQEAKKAAQLAQANQQIKQ